ncbi:MAG TPA: T9SS type A sorting domain-containing protein [Chitinophagaceae bacterium]
MKTKFTSVLRRLTAMLLMLLALAEFASAQLPDCVGGGTMYAVFNRQEGSTTADSMEIRPVTISTGAIGSLVGGKRYWIRKRLGTTSTYYYGSAALGVDLVTNRFYVMTQMSSAMQKDIITIDPVTGTQTVIGTTPTTPTSLNNYHFVKMAISPDGYGYAIGVHRDTTSAAATYNPLVRFTTCGAVPTAGCSTIELLGYLPSTGNMYKQLLFNGDIAFDIFGNLYFATAAFERVASIYRYTDARLFRIDAADIPVAAGTGTIPMTFVADYDGLDSTVINGIGLDPTGAMYLTTRRFTGVQTSPQGPSVSEFYSSPWSGYSSQISPFAPITTNYSVADLASCYWPTTILGIQKMQLIYKYENGKVNLKWQVNNNTDASSFEVQRSDDGSTFETIATVSPINNGQSSVSYTHADLQNGHEKNKFYRIKEVMRNGTRFYSNVVNVTFNSKFNLTGNIKPNPFVSQMEVSLWLRSSNLVNVRILDQSGRAVHNQQFTGRSGDNKLRIDRLGSLNAGIYIVEMSVQDEVIREKVIKQ